MTIYLRINLELNIIFKIVPMANSVGHIILSVCYCCSKWSSKLSLILAVESQEFHRAPGYVFQNCCQVDPLSCVSTNLDNQGEAQWGCHKFFRTDPTNNFKAGTPAEYVTKKLVFTDPLANSWECSCFLLCYNQRPYA